MHAAVNAPETPQGPQRVAAKLGVAKSFRQTSGSAVAVHEVLQSGLPRRALLKVVQSVSIPTQQLLLIFGISERTFMRLKGEPDKLLGPEQSGRLWRFAEVLAKAEDVFGSSERAVQWMMEPAMALENRRPIELLTTPVGAQLVDDVIERMRYGVYQ